MARAKLRFVKLKCICLRQQQGQGGEEVPWSFSCVELLVQLSGCQDQSGLGSSAWVSQAAKPPLGLNADDACGASLNSMPAREGSGFTIPQSLCLPLCHHSAMRHVSLI